MIHAMKWIGLVPALGLLAGGIASSSADETRKPLTTVESIRTLPPDQVAASLPVRLRGRVLARTWSGFFVFDGLRGILIDWKLADTRGLWHGPKPPENQTKPGDMVEITGLTEPARIRPRWCPRVSAG